MSGSIRTEMGPQMSSLWQRIPVRGGTRMLRIILSLLILVGTPLEAMGPGYDDMPETGSILRKKQPATIPEDAVLKNDGARAIVDQFGACLISHYRMRAKAAIATVPGSASEYKLVGRLYEPDCIYEGELRAPITAVRGAMFRAIYAEEYRTVAPQLRPQPIDFSQGSGVATFATERATLLRQFADCIVRFNPGGARTLVLSSARTAEEAQALTALSGDMSQCLTPGSKIEFSKGSLVWLISEVLYRDSLPGTRMSDASTAVVKNRQRGRQ